MATSPGAARSSLSCGAGVSTERRVVNMAQVSILISAHVPVTRGALLRSREANPSRSALSEVGKGAGCLPPGDGRALAPVGDGGLFEDAEPVRDGIGVDIGTKEEQSWGRLCPSRVPES